MAKCGKGCLPECEYFTTAGCVSPFNCAYKIGEISSNSATTIPHTIPTEYFDGAGIKKWYRSIIKQGHIAQEPMNYDSATLKAYIAYLEAENANLQEQIKKLKGENKQ